MTRVIPRDIFNDADLLKCLGHLLLAIEDRKLPSDQWSYEYDGLPFDIQQNPDDGSTHVANVRLSYRGEPVDHHRPINCRTPWTLFVTTGEGEELSVFEDIIPRP